jgi:small subunit ribosomal protein S20
VPNIKSAKKRVLVNATKAEQNKAQKSALKTALKKADLAIANNQDDKVEVVKTTVAAIDKAAAKGILNKNCAARKKSGLAKKLNAAK